MKYIVTQMETLLMHISTSHKVCFKDNYWIIVHVLELFPPPFTVVSM